MDEIRRIVHSIDTEEALACLTRHVVHTNSAAVELLALEQSTCFAAELQRCAVVQLRALRRLPERLAYIAGLVADERCDVGLRLGLRAVLRKCTRHSALDELDLIDLLEPTLVLEKLLFHLTPWLPKPEPELESELGLDILQLGIPGYRLPAVRARLVSAWRCFHRLRGLEPGVLGPHECPMSIGDRRLGRLTYEPRARTVAAPPPPSLTRRRLERELAHEPEEPSGAIPQPIVDTSSFELIG